MRIETQQILLIMAILTKGKSIDDLKVICAELIEKLKE